MIGKKLKNWIKARSLCVQQAIKTWPPNGYYLLKTTGQKGSLYGYEERPLGKCSTCKFLVEEGYNVRLLVFGVLLNDLKKIPRAKIATQVLQ